MRKKLYLATSFFALVWMASYIVFLVGLGLMPYFENKTGNSFLSVTLGAILVGIASFLSMLLVGFFFRLEKDDGKKLRPLLNISIINIFLTMSGGTLLLLTVFVLIPLLSKHSLKSSNENTFNSIDSAAVLSAQALTATPSPTIYIKPTRVPTIDPNPPVHCQISAECGGGTRLLRKSECDNVVCCLTDQRCGGPRSTTKLECDNSFCCLLNDGTGKLLPSKSACDNYYSNNSQGNTPNSAPTYPPCTIYYPALGYSQTYSSASPEECQQWRNNAKPVVLVTSAPYTPTPTQDTNRDQRIVLCKEIAKTNYDNAKSNCLYKARGSGAVSSSWYQQCVQSATETYDYERAKCV